MKSRRFPLTLDTRFFAPEYAVSCVRKTRIRNIQDVDSKIGQLYLRWFPLVRRPDCSQLSVILYEFRTLSLEQCKHTSQPFARSVFLCICAIDNTENISAQAPNGSTRHFPSVVGSVNPYFVDDTFNVYIFL